MNLAVTRHITKHDLDGRDADQVATALLNLCYGDKRLAVRELFHTARMRPELSTRFLLDVLCAIEQRGQSGT